MAARTPAATVVAIFGPTAIGKTAIAVALARLLAAAGRNPIAISADALQVYAGLGRLTGAPDAGQIAALDHRLVGTAPVSEEFSAGRFAELAHAEIDAALAAGRTPIVVGGTGLYLRAALTQLELGPPLPQDLREQLEERVKTEGAPTLHAALRSLSPKAAAAIEPNDRSRVVRALGLALKGDAPAAGRKGLWSDEVRHPTLLVGVTMDRAALYARIEERVDEIVAAGAEEEVRQAIAAGASRTARAAIGFEELAAGDPDGMRQRSRNLAKRQLTWMRKLGGVTTIDVTDRPAETVAAEIMDLLKERFGFGRPLADPPR